MKWCLQWRFDGCQWIVEEVNMYEGNVEKGEPSFIGTYIECIWFVYEHLMGCPGNTAAKHINLHCKEYTYKIYEEDLPCILKKDYPEEFI